MTALHAAQHAFDHIAFYRKRYGVRPQAWAEVPFIGESDLHLAEGFLECVERREAMVWAITPFSRHGRPFPLAPLEDEADQEARQERLLLALALAGVDPQGARKRFLLVSDDARGPFASDIAAGLAWERHQASICYWMGDPAQLAEDVAAHAPDFLLPVCPSVPVDALPGVGERFTVIRITRVEEENAHVPPGTAAWLFFDPQGLLAACSAADPRWRHPDGQYLFETNPATGLTHVTTLRPALFPLIRYGLGLALVGVS